MKSRAMRSAALTPTPRAIAYPRKQNGPSPPAWIRAPRPAPSPGERPAHRKKIGRGTSPTTPFAICSPAPFPPISTAIWPPPPWAPSPRMALGSTIWAGTWPNGSMISTAPPQPAASVGVAKPKSILPNAAKTKAAGGTNPRKNSIHKFFYGFFIRKDSSEI